MGSLRALILGWDMKADDSFTGDYSCWKVLDHDLIKVIVWVSLAALRVVQSYGTHFTGFKIQLRVALILVH